MRINTALGFEANVCRDGVPLEEHEGDAESSAEGMRYIEATSGSNFTISLRVEPHRMKQKLEDHIACEVRLDGSFACSWIYSVTKPNTNSITGRTGTIHGQHVIEKFEFGDLVTNDGPVGTIQKEDVQHLGEIHVLLRWIRRLSSRPEVHRPLNNEAKDSLPEKCLKGRSISNRASYGKAEPTTQTYVAIADYPHGMEPFAKFVFKYRSRNDLQIEGVIPRGPTPAPLEERDPNDLSAEEARELIRRMRENGTNRDVKIKKEKRARDAEDEEDDDDEVEVTEERSTKRARLSTDSGVEIIDLTDD